MFAKTLNYGGFKYFYIQWQLHFLLFISWQNYNIRDNQGSIKVYKAQMKPQENTIKIECNKQVSGLTEIYRQGFSSTSGLAARQRTLVYAAGKNVVIDSVDSSVHNQLIGHDNTVCCTCVSNNLLIASGQLASPGNKNYDSPVLLWKFGMNDPIGRLFGLKEGVKCLMFSKDCRFLAGASYKNQFIIWDIKSQKQIYMKLFQNPISILNFTNDSIVLVVEKLIQNLVITPLIAQNKPPIFSNFTLPSTGLPRIYTCLVEIQPDLYAIGTESGQICVFSKGIYKSAIVAGKGKVNSIAILNCKQIYASVGNELVKFDVIGQQLKEKQRKLVEPLRSLAINEKAELFGLSKNSILQISTNMSTKTIRVSHSSKVRQIVYRNGILASIDQQGCIFIRNLKGKNVSLSNSWNASNVIGGRCIQINSSLKILAGFADGKIISLSENSNKAQWQLSAHKGAVTTIYCGENYFLSGGEDCIVRIWSNTRQLINQLTVHQKTVSKVLGDLQSPNIIYSCSIDKSIQAYDLKSDKKVYFKQAQGGNITDMIMDPKTSDLITCGVGSAVSHWKNADNKPYRSIVCEKSNIIKVSISQDGKILTMGHENGLISLFNCQNNSYIGTHIGHSTSITGIQWVDPSNFFTSSEDFCISLWSLQ